MADVASYQITCEEVASGSVANLTPGKLQKVVHLVRHGQGTHNLFALASIKPGDSCPCVSHRPGCPYLNPAHEDAKLTQRGRLQATAVGSKLIFTKPVPEIALISPLYQEQIRERMGMHICDKRSDKEKLVNYFKNVDFSNIAPGPDVLYSQRCETPEQVAKRGKQFFLTLKDRPETSILLVTHSSFLFNTLSRSFITPDPKVSRRFATGEVRCVILTFEKE